MAMTDPLPWLILLPLLWATGAFLLGPARGARLALAGTAVQLWLAFALAAKVSSAGTALHHPVGGWGAPLGIDLAADGLAALLLILTQFVALPLFLYARAYFAGKSPAFWPLAGFLLAGMNALFLSADLFNLYVTLELVGLAAVGLVAMGGGAQQLAAALRGDVASGLFFRGDGRLPFGTEIRPVRELIDHLLSGVSAGVANALAPLARSARQTWRTISASSDRWRLADSGRRARTVSSLSAPSSSSSRSSSSRAASQSEARGACPRLSRKSRSCARRRLSGSTRISAAGSASSARVARRGGRTCRPGRTSPRARRKATPACACGASTRQPEKSGARAPS